TRIQCSTPDVATEGTVKQEQHPENDRRPTQDHPGILTPVLIEKNTDLWKTASALIREHMPVFNHFTTPDGIEVKPTRPQDLVKMAVILPQIFSQPMLPPHLQPQRNKDDRPQQIPPLGQPANAMYPPTVMQNATVSGSTLPRTA